MNDKRQSAPKLMWGIVVNLLVMATIAPSAPLWSPHTCRHTHIYLYVATTTAASTLSDTADRVAELSMTIYTKPHAPNGVDDRAHQSFMQSHSLIFVHWFALVPLVFEHSGVRRGGQL